MKISNLPNIPQRDSKPRTHGLTMVMDKGLSTREAEDLIAVAGEYIDFIKLGFGTSLLTPNTKEKIRIYQKAGVRPYLGGTLFEVFAVRGLIREFKEHIDNLGLDLAEVSDGVMNMEHKQKCLYIEELAKEVTVISEVGSKKSDVLIPNSEWVAMMRDELNAGSWRVIAEAREGGNVGIYNNDQSANASLINDLVKSIGLESIIWEAPIKNQQVWLIQQMGSNVNLGNIAPSEAIALETLRLGLRGDTFGQFLT